jgi:hypothetical protein
MKSRINLNPAATSVDVAIPSTVPLVLDPDEKQWSPSLASQVAARGAIQVMASMQKLPLPALTIAKANPAPLITDLTFLQARGFLPASAVAYATSLFSRIPASGRTTPVTVAAPIDEIEWIDLAYTTLGGPALFMSAWATSYLNKKMNPHLKRITPLSDFLTIAMIESSLVPDAINSGSTRAAGLLSVTTSTASLYSQWLKRQPAGLQNAVKAIRKLTGYAGPLPPYWADSELTPLTWPGIIKRFPLAQVPLNAVIWADTWSQVMAVFPWTGLTGTGYYDIPKSIKNAAFRAAWEEMDVESNYTIGGLVLYAAVHYAGLPQLKKSTSSNFTAQQIATYMAKVPSTYASAAITSFKNQREFIEGARQLNLIADDYA